MEAPIPLFHVPTRVYLGVGALAALPGEAERLGRCGLIIAGQASARQSGLLRRIEGQLGERGHGISVLDGIAPNPPLPAILAHASTVRAARPDYIVAVGGGAAMDAAKLLAVVAPDRRFLVSVDWQRFAAPPAHGSLPVLCVPTTAGSGSEANNGVSLTDAERCIRFPIFCESFFPAASFVDPSLATGLGPEPTAWGGVDMFCHIAEHYLTARDTTRTEDRIAEAILSTVVDVLPRAVAMGDDLSARTELARCSILAITDHLARGKGTSPVHRLEHAAAINLGCAHGEGLALLLPAYLGHLAGTESSRLAQLGTRVLGLSARSEKRLAGRTLERLQEWLQSIGTRFGLRSRLRLATSPDELARRCLQAFGSGDYLHPLAPLDHQSIRQIYESAWD